MKTASITEAKNRLSALIDQVRGGETIVITDRGRPVARLSSLAADPSDATTGRLERLERAGLVRRGSTVGPLAEILRPPPRPGRRASIVEALIAERAAGR